MKKSNLMIQVVLSIAVVVLFILHFTNKQCSSHAAVTNDTTKVQTVPGKIAFVMIDSVFKYYELVKDLNSKLESKQKQMDADLNDKTKNFQSGYLDLQNKVQKGLVTRADAEQMQQQLAAQQQGLYQLQNQYQSQVAEESQVIQRQVFSAVMEYLKTYNQTHNYQYILANTFPSTLLYADESYNITSEVIAGLNSEYAAKSKDTKK